MTAENPCQNNHEFILYNSYAVFINFKYIHVLHKFIKSFFKLKCVNGRVRIFKCVDGSVRIFKCVDGRVRIFKCVNGSVRIFKCVNGSVRILIKHCFVGLWHRTGWTCEPCNCNGYSYECNSFSGKCKNCAYDTACDKCDCCADGFYGQPGTCSF